MRRDLADGLWLVVVGFAAAIGADAGADGNCPGETKLQMLIAEK